MSRGPKSVLQDKHWHALRLIEEGNLTLKQIASETGISTDTLYDLYEGNSEKQGAMADLFSSELRKIEKKISDDVKKLCKSNKKHSNELIERALLQIKQRKTLKDEDIKLIALLNNSLAKSTPNVEIGSLSYTFAKGLTALELLHEFNRLKNIVDGASQRGAVQTPLARGSRAVCLPLGPGSESEESGEDRAV